MIHKLILQDAPPIYTDRLSPGELAEMQSLGFLDEFGRLRVPEREPHGEHYQPRAAITNHEVLKEAFAYPLPSSFTRGLKATLKTGSTWLWISGTSAVDEQGRSVHAGDFRAQLWRTFRNITALLESGGATWHDVVRTTCYLRDIERDYDDFNRVRTWFYAALHLDPLPASTAIQARICRSDLLIEIEAIAILKGVESHES